MVPLEHGFKTHRDIAGVLANENENMRDHMRTTEKDTIEVVTFLKKQDVDKDSEVRSRPSSTRHACAWMMLDG